MLLELWGEGHVPHFMRQWEEVRTGYGGVEARFWVLPDYVCLGSNDDFVRARMNPRTAELIGSTVDAHLVTRKMVNLIYDQAVYKPYAQPWGAPYDASMMRTERWSVQDEKIRRQLAEAGWPTAQLNGESRRHRKCLGYDMLTAGHLKDVVTGPGMAARQGKNVGIYGWFQKDGSVIQGPSVQWDAHEVTYVDYSQGCRLVYFKMEVGGEERLVEDVLKDPELCALVSDDGPVEHLYYSAL
jgi:hypothetical protein